MQSWTLQPILKTCLPKQWIGNISWITSLMSNQSDILRESLGGRGETGASDPSLFHHVVELITLVYPKTHQNSHRGPLFYLTHHMPGYAMFQLFRPTMQKSGLLVRGWCYPCLPRSKIFNTTALEAQFIFWIRNQPFFTH